ncbi:tetratricopeptide repeat protein, partial [Candidatus Thorarchaeota archaeon]
MPMDVSRLLLEARQCLDSGQYDSATSKLEKVLAVVPESAESHVEALVHLGEILWQRGKYEEARDILKKAQELGEKRGYVSLSARAQRLTGNTLIDQGFGQLAERAYRTALEMFESVDDARGIARAYNNLGIISVDKGNFVDALRYYEQSLNMHRELGDEVGTGMCLNNIGEIHRFKGEYELAEGLYQESLVGDTERGDRYGQAICWGNLGAVSYGRKEYSKAEERVQRAVQIFNRLGTRDLVYVEIRGLLVGIMAATKRFAEGQIHLDAIWDAAEGLNSDAADIICNFYGGLLAQRQWNLSFARKHYNNCLELSKRARSFEFVLLSLMQLVEIEMLHYRVTGEDEYLEAMRNTLHQALDLAQRHNLHGPLVELMVLNALFHVESQNPEQGLEFLAEAKEVCHKKGF